MVCAGGLEVPKAPWKELPEKLWFWCCWLASDDFGGFWKTSSTSVTLEPWRNMSCSQLLVSAHSLGTSIFLSLSTDSSPVKSCYPALDHHTEGFVGTALVREGSKLSSGENTSSFTVPSLVRANRQIIVGENRLVTTEEAFWSFLGLPGHPQEETLRDPILALWWRKSGPLNHPEPWTATG